MTYTQRGNLHTLTRITGPTHNLLAIEFGPPPPTGPTIEPLPTTSPGPTRIHPDQIKSWVLTALTAANADRGSQIQIRRIQFVPTDIPNPQTYAAMTRELISRAHPARTTLE